MNSLHLKSHIECLQASTNIPQATFDCAINRFPSVLYFCGKSTGYNLDTRRAI
jgi:hypothetical protein